MNTSCSSASNSLLDINVCLIYVEVSRDFKGVEVSNGVKDSSEWIKPMHSDKLYSFLFSVLWFIARMCSDVE